MAKSYLCECDSPVEKCWRHVEVPENIWDQRGELEDKHGTVYLRHPECEGAKEENGHRVLKKTARYVIVRDAEDVYKESSGAEE